MDLLNKIFVIDEQKRITLKGIREHPWYNTRLDAKYASAFERFSEEQVEKNHYTATRRLSEARLPPLCRAFRVHRRGAWSPACVRVLCGLARSLGC